MTKIKPYINKYHWEGISFPSEKDGWKKFKKNNVTIALNVFYAEKEKISCLCVKAKLNREKQVIVLMIPNREGLHYLVVKKLSALKQE